MKTILGYCFAFSCGAMLVSIGMIYYPQPKPVVKFPDSKILIHSDDPEYTEQVKANFNSENVTSVGEHDSSGTFDFIMKNYEKDIIVFIKGRKK